MDTEVSNINTDSYHTNYRKLSLEGGMGSETTNINTDSNHTNYKEIIAGGLHGLGNHHHKH